MREELLEDIFDLRREIASAIMLSSPAIHLALIPSGESMIRKQNMIASLLPMMDSVQRRIHLTELMLSAQLSSIGYGSSSGKFDFIAVSAAA